MMYRYMHYTTEQKIFVYFSNMFLRGCSCVLYWSRCKNWCVDI